MMKLLYAKEMPDGNTALVIDIGTDQIIGGVARLVNLQSDYKSGSSLQDAIRRTNIDRTRMDFQWLWQRTVSRADYERAKNLDLEDMLTDAPPKTIDIKPNKKPGK